MQRKAKLLLTSNTIVAKLTRMEIKFHVPFACSPAIKLHLDSVFAGEYDVPLQISGLRIIDVGANFGAFSIWAAHRFPHSVIYAFEPHPETVKVLRENIIGYPVSVFDFGIGRPGMRPLYNGPNNEGEASLYQSPTNFGQKGGQHVEVRDPLTLPAAEIIKLDTEGCEVEIMEPLIAAGRKFHAVMFEYHRTTDRRKLDSILVDYILTGAHVYSPGRGIMKYLHKDLVAE